MSRQWPVAALCFFSIFASPHRMPAQALPTASGSGAALSVGVGLANYKIDYGQRWLGGVQGWVDANPWWWGGVEVEGRSLRYNLDLNTHASTLLAGPRISLSARAIEPYVKVLAGQGQLHFPYSYAHGTYLAVSGGGGVDLHLGRRLQVRVVDVEYQRWPGFTYGSMSSYGISAGVGYTVLGAKHR